MIRDQGWLSHELVVEKTLMFPADSENNRACHFSDLFLNIHDVEPPLGKLSSAYEFASWRFLINTMI